MEGQNLILDLGSEALALILFPIVINFPPYKKFGSVYALLAGSVKNCRGNVAGHYIFKRLYKLADFLLIDIAIETLIETF